MMGRSEVENVGAQRETAAAGSTSNIELLTPNGDAPNARRALKSLGLDVRCQTFSPAQRPSPCELCPAVLLMRLPWPGWASRRATQARRSASFVTQLSTWSNATVTMPWERAVDARRFFIRLDFALAEKGGAMPAADSRSWNPAADHFHPPRPTPGMMETGRKLRILVADDDERSAST